MEENKSNIHVVAMSAFTSPEIIEVRNIDWIGYGRDNDYFQYLIDRYTNSTTNQSIINGVVNQIFGKGLGALDARNKAEQFAAMKSLIKDKDVKRFITDRKMLGMAAFQINYKGGKVEKVTHFPMQTLRSEKVNEDGEIENWFWHPRWDEFKNTDELLKIPVFGSTNNKKTEIYVLQPYVAGYTYYSPVDYQGAVPYALLEEEIGDYLINDTINGFSGTTVINFNNGVPSDEQQRIIKNKVTKKLTGATGEKTIVAFNDNKENQTNVDKLPLDNAPEHYQYLSDEARNKLIIGHRVTSPILIGVRESGGGLGSNADEIKNSATLFDNIVIKPYQQEVIEVIDDILLVNDISLRLFFKTIQPLEFIDTDGLDKETIEEETGIEQSKMSKDNDFSDEEGDALIGSLKEDLITEEWEIVDKREYSEENENIEDWAKQHITKKKSLMARIIKSDPSAESRLDKSFYKVRYEYSQKYSTGRSRSFCVQMMARTGRGVVYRKEDIDQASFQGVNSSFGHNGRPYSLFRFKGGVNCGHFWTEILYRLKTKTDGTRFVDRSLASSEEVDDIPQSFLPNPVGSEDAKTAPKDMPNNGHHPNF